VTRLARILLLAVLLALKPACGGSGGGGSSTPGTGVSMPALPPLVSPAPTAASLPGTLFPALAPDGSAAAHTVDATAGQTDAQVQTSLQNSINLGGKTSIDTGGVPRTIMLTTELIVPQGVPSAVILEGNDLVTLNGNFATRMIEMQFNTTLTLQRIRFAHGRAAQSGGAIEASASINQLTVINCTFNDCQTVEGGPDRGGGAIRAWNTHQTLISGCSFNQCAASNGGAVNSLGSQLTIIECTFKQNAAFGTGGGQDAGPSGMGGIGGAVYVDNVSNTATKPQLAISGCVFNANVANDQAGAVFGYLAPGSGSTMIVDATTFCGNVVYASSGGGIYTLNETLTLTNSTFSGNSGANSGGLRCDNDTSNVTNCTFQGNHGGIGGAIGKFSGNLTLQNVTVAQNTSDSFAAGIFANVSTVTVNKSIFADNTAPDMFNGWHTNQSFATGGGNIQWPSVAGPTGIPITSSGTSLGDPKLNALAANAPGPTYTMSLGVSSAAINAPGGSGAPATDQRGVTRDALPDAGAYEN
jgi:hypothetical protein